MISMIYRGVRVITYLEKGVTVGYGRPPVI
jgi:hypothetical protein